MYSSDEKFSIVQYALKIEQSIESSINYVWTMFFKAGFPRKFTSMIDRQHKQASYLMYTKKTRETVLTFIC